MLWFSELCQVVQLNGSVSCVRLVQFNGFSDSFAIQSHVWFLGFLVDIEDVCTDYHYHHVEEAAACCAADAATATCPSSPAGKIASGGHLVDMCILVPQMNLQLAQPQINPAPWCRPSKMQQPVPLTLYSLAGEVHVAVLASVLLPAPGHMPCL
jgi:hypothetical protein